MRDSLRKFDVVRRVIDDLPERDLFRPIIVECGKTNPSSWRYILTLMAWYLHLGPFSRNVMEEIDLRIAELEVESPAHPAPARQTSRPLAPSQAVH